jgi:Na+/proline symporter
LAKITRYTKDTAGQQLLTVAAVVLIVWCAIAGLNVSNPPGDGPAGSGAVWYYLGVPLVGWLWGMANYDRFPSKNMSRRMTALLSMLSGSAMGFIVWLLVFATRNQEFLSDLLLGS